MPVTEEPSSRAARFVPKLPTKHFPPPEIRDMPEAPTRRQSWRLIGPGIVAAGVGLASGEFILWPYVASQVGLVFLWGAVVGVFMQFFINMEIERYALATGETVLEGFNRFWVHWGLFFAAMTVLGNLWPGWATGSATLVSYMVGGNATYIAIGMLLIVAVSLTVVKVVYTALERIIFVKIAAILIFIVVCVLFVIKKPTYAALPDAVTHFGEFPVAALGFATLAGAIAFSGAGGGQNLCQSNWIRDAGFGMGKYHQPPLGGESGHVEAKSTAGYVFVPDTENMKRWNGWWKFANTEQLVSFVAITIITIWFMSMVAHATIYGQDVPNSIGFIKIEGNVLGELVGDWFKLLFWFVGALSLFAASFGIIDYTARLVSNTVKTAYMRESTMSETKLYAIVVWSLCVIGCAVLLSGLNQPLVLLIISAVVGSLQMCVYSGLLVYMNRKSLPAPIQIRGFRAGFLVFCCAAYGSLFVLSANQQIQLLLK
jgi:Mn2+/Fe2+ NRAMP family transporter